MTPLPKRRHSSKRSGTRRAGNKQVPTATELCKNCGAPIQPHTVCVSCGFYKGRKVLQKTA